MSKPIPSNNLVLRGRVRAIAAVVTAISVGLGSVLVGANPAAAAADFGGFSYEVVNDGAVITGCTDDECATQLTIPYALEGNTVTGIENDAFQNAGVQKVTFMTTSQISFIGANAFAGNSLGQVVLPGNLTQIGEFAFGYAGVAGLSFGTNSKVETIGESAFVGNNLPAVTIPSTVTSIGKSAFQLSNMSSLSFASGSKVGTIGQEAFSGNTLASLTVPASVTDLGPSAFSSNILTTLNFAPGSKLETIGTSAFGYNELATLVIPATVTSIDDGAFFSNELTSIQFQTGIQLNKLNEDVFGGNDLTQVAIPDSVTEIADGALANNLLTTVNFSPASQLTTIRVGAFYDNKLNSIAVPAGVTDVGDGAFMDNPTLANVRFLGDKPAFGTEYEPFSNTGSSPIFYSLNRTGWDGLSQLSDRTVIGVADPVITSQPQGVTAPAGQSATLSVAVDNETQGQGVLSYQWFKGEAAVSGANQSSFTTNQAGVYKVRVYSWAGSSTSQEATVTSTAPAPKPKPAPKPVVKKKQSVKVKLPSKLKRNKTYKLPAKTRQGVVIAWKVKGAGKCKINKKKRTITCKRAAGNKKFTLVGTAKATATLNSYKITIKRRVR